MMQIKASIKKELLAYFRTGKLVILTLVFLGWSMLSPLLIRSMGWAMDAFGPIYDEMGMDVSGVTEIFGSAASLGMTSAVSSLGGVCLIVMLILINSHAGGEQKKRSIMMPKSAGLRSVSYILPKFVVYPPIAFVLAIAGSLCAWGMSAMIFDYNDIPPAGVWVGGVLAGVSLMIYVCAHITIGTASGRAGMSAVICIAASLLVPSFFAVTGAEHVYNPFTLGSVAESVVNPGMLSSTSPAEILMSVVIALGIMVILYFVALFAQNARKIDNSGNEIRL